MRWLAAHTWLMALVLLVMLIVVSGYMGRPLNLLKDTEVDYLDADTVLAMRLLDEGQEREKTIRYEAEVEGGSRVLLFVREFKKDKFGNTAPYTFLGTAEYVSHNGSRPMNIVWKLKKPIPAKYLKKTNKLVVG